VAGGTSAVGQRVLEALLGDQAVRTLAERAREDLLRRTRSLLETEAERYDALLAGTAPGTAGLEALRAAVDALEQAR